MGRTIKGSQIVADIRAGMKDSALMKKYSLSRNELKSAFRQIELERESRIAAILTDIGKGMTQVAIMKNHRISSDLLEDILETATTLPEEQAAASCTGPVERCDRVTIDFRSEPRHKPLTVVSACYRKRRIGACLLRDISTGGLCLSGALTQVKATCAVAILGDNTGLVTPFELEAQCRWRHTDLESGQPIAGFKITRISPGNLNKLYDFIEHHTDCASA